MKGNLPSTLSALAIVLMASGLHAQRGDTLDLQFSTDKTVRHARFKPDTSGKRKLADAAQFLKTLHGASKNDRFVLKKTKTDNLGMTHHLYQQYYNGIPVEGAQYWAHGRQGRIETVNGEFVKVKIAGDKPAVSEKTALAQALAFVGAKRYKWEDAQLQAHLQKLGRAGYSPKGSLVVSRDQRQTGRAWRLSWKFTVSALEPESEQEVFVDATDGRILNAVSLLCHTNTPGTAQTAYSGTRNIIGDSFAGGFRLRESRSGVNIITLNAQRTTNYGSGIDFVDNDNIWTTLEHANANMDIAALDAHWAAETTLDYWLTQHGRNSINGSGMQVLSYVHYGNNMVNAQWDPTANAMAYGDGNGWFIPPIVSLDIFAHEFGHGICQYEANLAYQGESGALNEGFSDIWGAVIERWADPTKQTWIMGDDLGIIPNFTRFMNNPNDGNQPDTYLGTNWFNVNGCTPTGNNDACGVHTNSGVLNFCFFLLSEGGTGTNDLGNAYNVTGIGIVDAARIAYRAESFYLTSNATFPDARNAFINAANDLFGPNSCQSVATANAWNAVGVGNRHVATGLSVSGSLQVCGTSGAYSIANLPAGATVTWSKIPSWGPVDIDNPNNPTTTLTQVDYGTVQLQAIVTTPCGLNATVTSAPIQVGNPYMVSGIETNSNGLGAGANLCNHDYDYDDYVNTFMVTLNQNPPGWDTWTLHWELWGPDGMSASGTVTNPNLNNHFVLPASLPVGYYSIIATVTNSCGQVSEYYEQGCEYVNCNCFCLLSMNVFPNPASGGSLHVAVEEPQQGKSPDNAKAAASEPITFTLYDVTRANVVRTWKVPPGQKKHSLNTSGVKAGQYILVMSKGKLKRSQQVMIR